MTFLGKLFILIGSLWIALILFIAYTVMMQWRQRKILRYIAMRLREIEKKLDLNKQQAEKADEMQHVTQEVESEEKVKVKPETKITINKSEPISKYETVNLPDEIDINFVDR